ncbi:unnamed protein product [Thlaspi arvense]|uniref:NAC domain-containing protein n=1 Tax=Thlaspi arvense TaxID=13288 RepID=A0AAU9RG80_THLAR|nr:unnamed protein product [Thlaspi arvense]
MVNPVGFRFRPNDEEIVDHYLRRKNQDNNTSHVNEVISTVDICSFDPWELPSQSKMESTEKVWFFFGCKKELRGDRQSRKTKTGFWKKTGVTMDITRKRGNREKIGEKRVLVFHYSKALGGSKSGWVMHEYVATVSSPTQMMMTYTFCKVMFKGDKRKLSPPSAAASGIEHSHSLMIPHVNNPEGSSFEGLHGQELENPRQFSGIIDEQQEAQLGAAIRRALDKVSDDDLNSFINNNDEEQGNNMFVQEDRNDYIPKKSLTGVFIGHSSDDSDSDFISATTSSIQTSSTSDSFGSSNHRIDQNTGLQESPNSTIKLSEKVSQDIGEHQLGQETISNKRAGFFYTTIQRFIKKIQLCCSIS